MCTLVGSLIGGAWRPASAESQGSAGGASQAVLPGSAEADFFERSVRPLLVAQCLECHGPDDPSGNFRLTSRDGAIRGGDSGPAIVLGNAEASLMIQAVRQTGELRMPPDSRLNDEQVGVLARWIALGAPWPAQARVERSTESSRVGDDHWAFRPIANPPVPALGRSHVAQTPVDHFVLSELDARGILPASKADRRTLIRRATYDLTGLPPTPAEVDAFVRDPSGDAEAFERLVERLLESPQYGVQWARHWLDVARYADTKGYVAGSEERYFVQSAAYRDWVVSAFNADLPYDRFLELQLAADQASPDDPSALAAMGFLTLGRRFQGVTHDIIDDRIDVVTRGTLGLTVACARCHDHKYDPIPTSDYYALYGIFMNCVERQVEMSAQGGDGSGAAHSSATAAADAGSSRSPSPSASPSPSPTPSSATAAEWALAAAYEQELRDRQRALQETLEREIGASHARVRKRVADYLVAQTELEKYPEEGFNQVLGVNDMVALIVRRWQAYLAQSDKERHPVFLAWRRYAALPPDEFQTRAVDVGRELAALGPEQLNPRVQQAFRAAPRSMREAAERYGTLLQTVDQEWERLVRDAADQGKEPPTMLADPAAEALRQILYGAGSPCRVPDEPIVNIEYFFDRDTRFKIWAKQAAVDRWLLQAPDMPTFAVALTDRAALREARVFRRGNPSNKGEVVDRRFLTALVGVDAPPFAQGSGRWELARAIADPSNPLTARVWANRVWMHHFGWGLVKTPSDFGVRAEPPSHPALLDWLASQLRSSGWSTKALHRAIMLSATYQQASVNRLNAGEDARLDPENRLLWRMNVRRLGFEELRDTLLSLTGELDLQLGGIATELFPSSDSNRRRTLYGLVDRQYLPNVHLMFDFANPDLHTPQRNETSVPQQALFGLNHPFTARRAEALAAQLDQAVRAGEVEGGEGEKVAWLFRRALQRSPTLRQQQSALAFLAGELSKPEIEAPRDASRWQYGYSALDDKTDRPLGFTHLPHFTGSAWQGGASFPAPVLGRLQLTAEGGNGGNDARRAVIRRWIAPRSMKLRIESTLKHEATEGDGVRGWIAANQTRLRGPVEVHHKTESLNIEELSVEAGDTIDFIVDGNRDSEDDEFLWAPILTALMETGPAGTGPAGTGPSEKDPVAKDPVERAAGDASEVSAPGASEELANVARPSASSTWSAAVGFAGPSARRLEKWEQLAQVLLLSNELTFLD